MWLLGAVALLAVTAGLSLALNRRPRTDLAPIPWDIPRVATTYTTILGSLAGFSVVSSVFIANLTVARESPEYESVIAMFLMGFITFLGTAMQYATTPNLPDSDAFSMRVQRLAFCYANQGYYAGIGMSWLALRLLLLAIGLPYAAGVFTWLLLISVFAGAVRSAHFLYRLTLLDRRACILTPVVGFGAAAVYRLGLAELVPDLVPAQREPFLIAVVGFALAAAGFGIHSALIAFGDEPAAERLLGRIADGVTLIYTQTLITTIGLLTFVVALA